MDMVRTYVLQSPCGKYWAACEVNTFCGDVVDVRDEAFAFLLEATALAIRDLCYEGYAILPR